MTLRGATVRYLVLLLAGCVPLAADLRARGFAAGLAFVARGFSALDAAGLLAASALGFAVGLLAASALGFAATLDFAAG